MDAPTAARVTQWLRASRGSETQENLAADITSVTGWRLTRDRYSKYESGSLPIGPKVLAHFIDYWAARHVPGPSFAPEPVRATETPDLSAALISAMTAALLAQTQALTDVRVELAAIRETMTTARGAAVEEREAQMRVLAELGDQLEALLARAGTGSAGADPVSAGQ